MPIFMISEMLLKQNGGVMNTSEEKDLNNSNDGQIFGKREC